MEFIIKPALNPEGNWHLFFQHNGITVHTGDCSQYMKLDDVKEYAIAVVEHSAYLDVDTVVIERW